MQYRMLCQAITPHGLLDNNNCQNSKLIKELFHTLHIGNQVTIFEK